MDFLARTLMGLGCHDCDFIPKVPNAGATVSQDGQRVQIMHNGVVVVAGAYHGDWMAHLIRGLQGHHEPQEEALFHEVVRRSRNNSLFVELGCYWAYYTNWFLQSVSGSTALCIEPDPSFLAVGKQNVALNDNAGRVEFVEAWVGGTAGPAALTPETWNTPRSLPMINAGALRQLTGGRTIEVLQSPISGFSDRTQLPT